MIHLFKKIYIETDRKLDVDENRIVISESLGHNFSPVYDEICAGKLYYYSENFESVLRDHGADEIAQEKDYTNKTQEEISNNDYFITLKDQNEIFDNFYEFLNFVDRCYEEKKDPLYIHVDQKSFNFFMVYWYKILFPNITFDSLSSLLKSYLLYNKAFGSSSMVKMRSVEFDLVFEMENLETLFNSLEIDSEKSKSFVENNKQFLSLEFLLSSYHYDKSCTQELLTPVSTLLKKVIEHEMYEAKERIYIHLNSKNFLRQLDLNEKYNIYNIEEILEEKQLSVFFDRSIWVKTNNVLEGSSSGTINFSCVSDEDIENICEIRAYTETTKKEHSEQKFYAYFKHKKNIFSCIKYFREKKFLTENEMNDVLLDDMKNAISFFHTMMVPINFYFLDYILKSKLDNNIENLKTFVLR
jgi:hypothetical protein